MVWTKGESLSSALTVSVLRARDTGIPSFTSDAACLRLAGVIRLTAPIWSCLPQRPQLDSSVIQVSTWAAVTAWPACASRFTAIAEQSRTTAVPDLLDMSMISCGILSQTLLGTPAADPD